MDRIRVPNLSIVERLSALEGVNSSIRSKLSVHFSEGPLEKVPLHLETANQMSGSQYDAGAYVASVASSLVHNMMLELT